MGLVNGVPTGSTNQIDNIITFFASEEHTPSGVLVGAISTLALAENNSRKSAIFTNASNEAIYLSLGSAAEMNKGIYLASSGGKFEINQVNLYFGAVYAICQSGLKILCVSEGV
jgi:hypothetical protein